MNKQKTCPENSSVNEEENEEEKMFELPPRRNDTPGRVFNASHPLSNPSSNPSSNALRPSNFEGKDSEVDISDNHDNFEIRSSDSGSDQSDEKHPENDDDNIYDVSKQTNFANNTLGLVDVG